jgi:hypothetical protein
MPSSIIEDGMSEEKVMENKLRRMAARQGLQLVKCRRRDPRALGYGGYMVVDIARNFVVAGAHPIEYSLTLEDVEEHLTI